MQNKMKKIFLVTLLYLSGSILNAQNLHFTVFGGVSNYQGELQPKRFTFQQAYASGGLGILYELNDKLYLRGNVTFGKIGGSDNKHLLNQDRNLSFTSPIVDIHLGIEYDILNLYDKSITPFVFGGVSIFNFNPSTIDSVGKKTYLQPLGTEGQGFYLNRTKYNLSQLAIPLGGGIKLALSENVRVRFEIGLRKTFTDYLDDVSSTYADQNLLLINNGQRSVDLAFRGDELKSSATNYPSAGTQRGNVKTKDWYYFTGLGISFRLTPKFNTGKTGCPVNIY